MSTSASITAKLSNGRWASVYVYCDGYISHTGAILANHYATQERVDLLMALGDLSQVGPYVGCPDGHTFEKPVEHYCIAYHRDRGEKLSLSISDSPRMAWKNGPNSQRYDYFWNGAHWWLISPTEDEISKDRLLLDIVDKNFAGKQYPQVTFEA